ncbi:hypothetical protein GCM10010909_34760 [Acidocella aquatica]|uniref:Uncharacterized protein n=1 Tax=Acidocella aquatica TaxID=1922313 RepID=A0ABQ6A9A1_9PROT|nr:hypothetical protein [Acidocella aquatica]GLR68794.1 hypothetical protein GCM10010909_34760 [Acidocella aquatica]
MGNANDTRIQVLFGAAPGAMDAVLLEEGLEPPKQGYVIRFALAKPGHFPGCFCCQPRGPIATALGQLFRDRATGKAPYFKRLTILASPAGEAAAREALTGDAVSRARYSLENA